MSIKSVSRELEKALKALANRRRLHIVAYLKRHGEANVLDIAEELDLSFRATSRHLNVLRLAGVLERDQRDTHMWYRVVGGHPALADRLIELL